MTATGDAGIFFAGPGPVRQRGSVRLVDVDGSWALRASDGTEVGIYVTLAPGSTLDVNDLATSLPLPVHPDLGEPLRALAEARGIAIGSATEFYWPTTRRARPRST